MDHIDYISQKHEDYEDGEELDRGPDVKMPQSPDIPPNLTVESQGGYGQTATG